MNRNRFCCGFLSALVELSVLREALPVRDQGDSGGDLSTEGPM
jgi:hypothetical protein